MEAQSDFSALVELLNAHEVEYVIVGAHALALCGVVRYTGDLEICLRPDPENGARMTKVLDAFGFASLGIGATEFCDPDIVIQLGVAPVRIDLLTTLSGVSWEELQSGKVSGEFGDVPAYYISRDALIKNKRATGRLRDLADIEALGEA